MNNNITLLAWIFLGDFGLFTAVPRYLFLTLFPVMVFLGILGQILVKIPLLQHTHPLINQFFYGLIGLGCTTAALASLGPMENHAMRLRMIWILILLIPCSSQLTLIFTFASMVTLRVFAAYLCFCTLFLGLIYFVISRFLPLNDHLSKPPAVTSGFGFSGLIHIIRTAFFSILDTALSFCVGSTIISILMYYGFLDWTSGIFGPFMEHFLHLPPEAASLFILSVLKRDFGSASLLAFAGGGAFDAIQLVVMLMMMTFSVPCFNSAILLIKQQKLPEAFVIWLGSLFVSVLIGKVVSTILLICFI